jgi:hypothetical protein
MDVPALVTALSRFALATEQGRAGARLPSLGTAVDWPAVLELATVHRVAPLIRQALAAAPKGAVPGPIMAQFDAALWHSQAATLLCEYELASLLTTLAAARVNVLVLKGATLAHTLYPQPELRPYHDLDILCRHAEYPRLACALTAAGYAAEAKNEPWVRLSPLASFPVQTYRPPSGTLDIEVHTDVLQLGLVERNHENFWSEAETLSLGSVAMRSLAPIHQVLHLAAHAHRHGYVRLLWLVDLDLFVRRWGVTLDWASAMALARDEGMGLVLRHALATTRAVLGTPLPPLPPPTREERLLAPLYRWLWPHAPVRRLERIERRRLLRFRPDSGDPRDFSYGLMLLGRRREKLKVLAVRTVSRAVVRR